MQNLNYASNLLSFVCFFFFVKNHVCDGLGTPGWIFVWDTKRRLNIETPDPQSWGLAVCLPLIQTSCVPAKPPPDVRCLSLVSSSHGRRDGCASTSCRMYRSPWTSSNTDRSLKITIHNIKSIFVVICCHPCWAFIILINDSSIGTHICSFLGQTGQYQERWHSRWKPQADPGADMDHHPPFPGNEGHF